MDNYLESINYYSKRIGNFQVEIANNNLAALRTKGRIQKFKEQIADIEMKKMAKEKLRDELETVDEDIKNIESNLVWSSVGHLLLMAIISSLLGSAIALGTNSSMVLATTISLCLNFAAGVLPVILKYFKISKEIKRKKQLRDENPMDKVLSDIYNLELCLSGFKRYKLNQHRKLRSIKNHITYSKSMIDLYEVKKHKMSLARDAALLQLGARSYEESLNATYETDQKVQSIMSLSRAKK